MKARVVGTNDVFADVEKVVINGITYMPEVLEFEVDDNYDYVYTSSNVVDWGKVRIKAAIAVLPKAVEDVVKFAKNEEDKIDIPQYTAKLAIELADALIKELKGE